jgi:hypothetical protein
MCNPCNPESIKAVQEYAERMGIKFNNVRKTEDTGTPDSSDKSSDRLLHTGDDAGDTNEKNFLVRE